MSDLYKSSDVVLMNNKYYISFTESCSEPISLNNFEQYLLRNTDGQEGENIAQEIICNAVKEAEKLIDEANIQANNIIKQAIKQKEEDYNSGYLKGMEQAEKQYYDQIENVNSAFKEALHTKNEIITDSEPQMIKLSLNIAEKILHEKINLSEESVKTYFENAIEDILRNDFEVLSVRLNKFNIENFYPDWEIEKFMLNIKHDARLDNNACIVETETGDIDISVFTQLSEVSRKLISIA